jgi:DNA-binding phage protein
MGIKRKIKDWGKSEVELTCRVADLEREFRELVRIAVEKNRLERGLSIQDVAIESGLCVQQVNRVLHPNPNERVYLDVILTVCESVGVHLQLSTN